MGFRERPEYQNWRDSVFRLFGQTCIRCGHAGNIHAHHVMPVEDYPELAFDPTNGVPLCGNCHVAIKGNELAHADDLKRLQRAILGGEAAGTVTSARNETELRELAYAEPSNTEAVEQWFAITTDAQAVNDFYNEQRQTLKGTSRLCQFLTQHLRQLEKWHDVITVADVGMRCAELEETGGTLAPSDTKLAVVNLGYAKWRALSKLASEELKRGSNACAEQWAAEAGRVAGEITGRFPELANLHYFCAYMTACRAEIEYVTQGNHNNLATALRYGKRALALASTCEEQIEALRQIAEVYKNDDLYADALDNYRKALEIDTCNADLMGEVAFYGYIASSKREGDKREALRMLKHGLLLDPENVTCGSYWDLLQGDAANRKPSGGCLVVIVGLVGTLGAAIGIAIMFVIM